MAAHADKTKPYFPLSGVANDGWSKDGEATATCFCGAVQIAFPTKEPGLVRTFVCHCADCRKITASMFASNFTVKDEYIRFIRGGDNLSSFEQNKTVAAAASMRNDFCKTCGTLLRRVGERFPGMSIMRIGTVDNETLHENELRPKFEDWTSNRVEWLQPIAGTEQAEKQR